MNYIKSILLLDGEYSKPIYRYDRVPSSTVGVTLLHYFQICLIDGLYSVVW